MLLNYRNKIHFYYVTLTLYFFQIKIITTTINNLSTQDDPIEFYLFHNTIYELTVKLFIVF